MRKPVPYQGRRDQARRPECVEGRKEGTPADPNGNSLLLLPRSLEGLALRFQIRHLESRLRALRNDYPTAPLPRFHYEGPLYEGGLRQVRLNRCSLQPGPQKYA